MFHVRTTPSRSSVQIAQSCKLSSSKRKGSNLPGFDVDEVMLRGTEYNMPGDAAVEDEPYHAWKRYQDGQRINSWLSEGRSGELGCLGRQVPAAYLFDR